MSIPSNVDACRCRFMVMPTRFNIDIDYCRVLPMSKHLDPMSTLTIIDLYRCRFWSTSTHVDVSSGQLRLMSMAVQVDVDNGNCRHSVHGVVQWIQLILVTSCDLRLGPTAYDSLRWMWITRRPTPSHFIGQEEIIGPTYTTILLFWCIFNIHCNIDHIIMAACFVVASFKRFGCVSDTLQIRAYLTVTDRWVWINSAIVHSYVF